MDAAPLAMINDAIALSKSPLNTTIVLLSLVSVVTAVAGQASVTFCIVPFFIMAVEMPLSLLIWTNSLFVLLHQALISS
ncbi:hypothetical protein SDC9_124121 [bioreactor metagenome]|uniref:Uncharacterized protein n=1 Tax=bioreactor metagenome TaxID=1076179 RepID=A0A645CJJ1_9ZZZZ